MPSRRRKTLSIAAPKQLAALRSIRKPLPRPSVVLPSGVQKRRKMRRTRIVLDEDELT